MEAVAKVKGNKANITISDPSMSALKIKVAPAARGNSWVLTIRVPAVGDAPGIQIAEDRPVRHIEEFLKDRCIHQPFNTKVSIATHDLHRAYLDYCKDYEVISLGRNKFYEAVLAAGRGISKAKDETGKSIFTGVCLHMKAFSARPTEFFPSSARPVTACKISRPGSGEA